MAWVSGVGPIDLESGELRSSDIREQTRQCMQNLKVRLEEQGSSLDQVVWANWSLREPSEFDTFYEEWLRWFEGTPPMGQTTLLPLVHRRAGIRVTVGAIAPVRARSDAESADGAAMITALRAASPSDGQVEAASASAT
jgi:2-iminobutanoate/2-iminopropanoate deaminase